MANLQALYQRWACKLKMNMENKDLEKEVNTEEKNQSATGQFEEEINENEVNNMKVEESQDETENASGGEVTKLKGELEESKDKYLRLYSEFDNFRRRNAKERIELIKTASEDLITDLLPILDDFERAEKAFKEQADDKALAEGFGLIKNKFEKTLTSKGLKPMDSEPGIEFDSEIHEAITKIPAPDKKLKGKVVDVVEKGYLLNEKVVRYAKVVIGE